MVQVYHFSNTMRRMNSRSPPFAIIGLVVICIFISYNYWTLFSQNEDLKKDIEKLQAEIKIEGVKQEQFDKKNLILQSNVHDLSDKSEKLQQKLEKEDEIIKEFENNLQNRNSEILNLKSSINKKYEIEKEIKQQIDDKDEKIEDLIRDSQHVLTLKNDAEEALAEKDSQIITLKMQLEQVKAEMMSLRNKAIEKQKMDLKPKISAGVFNLPNIKQKEQYVDHGSLSYISMANVGTKDKGLAGIQHHDGVQILPRQPSNVSRPGPIVSVGKLGKMIEESLNQIQPQVKQDQNKEGVLQPPMELETEHKPAVENANIVLQNPPLDKNDIHNDPVDVVDQPQHLMDDKNVEVVFAAKPENNLIAPKDGVLPINNEQQQNVLLAPPQKHEENPDTAIDEDENEQVDTADDQDEEGKEIKKDLDNDENYEYENDQHHQPAFGNPVNKKHHLQFGEAMNGQQDEETPQRDNFHLIDDDKKANERVFEANLDKKIRNLGVRHL